MTLVVIGYIKDDDAIIVENGGVRAFVPDDMGNRHRREIAEWEAEGNVIPPYVEPLEVPVVDTGIEEAIRLLAVGHVNETAILTRVGERK